MVSLVNFHANATRVGWHLWEIHLRFAPGLLPGWIRNIRNPNPEFRISESETRNPVVSSRLNNPEPESLNLEPQTLKLKPSTQNPKGKTSPSARDEEVPVVYIINPEFMNSGGGRV